MFTGLVIFRSSVLGVGCTHCRLWFLLGCCLLVVDLVALINSSALSCCITPEPAEKPYSPKPGCSVKAPTRCLVQAPWGQPCSGGMAAELCVCVPSIDTAAITGHWSNITATVLPSNISLLETAELYAKLHVAFYDSNIAGWYIKFTSLFWRPVTAIQ